MSRVTRPAIAVLALGLALSTATAVQAAPAGSPGAAAATDPSERALAAVVQNPGEYGLSADDAAQLRVSSVVGSGALTHVYFQQQVDGIDVADAILNVTLDDRGVVHTAGNTIKAASGRANAATPKLSDVAAARAAARALDLTPTESFATSKRATGDDRARELGDGGVSTDPIPANLVYQRAAGGKLRLAWQLAIRPEDGANWWQVRMDASTGKELARADWVAHAGDSYEVYELPVEAPSFGPRTVVENPEDATASPFGWLDTDGVAGADTTVTNGNNVHAYTDLDDNDLPDPGSEADGGLSRAFTFPLDLAQAPNTYRPAAVTNLFYANNRIHDVLYAYGFDEAAGNFQLNNYGRGGAEGDAVLAEAQDGALASPPKANNANFGTPPDGQSPRMQMYLWNGTPKRDGDFDNGVIIHEYGHGVSNRLTGGPATASCLQNGEQAGEGWSDFLSYALTMPSSDEPASGRGIGTYALGQPTDGVGIRSQRYSRDTAVNTMRYNDIKVAFDPDGYVLPHDVGEVWGQMLWEMTWNLIDDHGYDADLIDGNGGNNLAIQLVLDGMKLQPCSPGFVDGRDAILAADQLTNAGANQCAIWSAFAKHGLGYSASQGSSSLITDGVEAYDVSPECEGLVVSAATATPTATPTRALEYQVTLANTGEAGLNNATATATVPAGTTFLNGTCAASYDDSTREVGFTVGQLAAGSNAECRFTVRVDPSAVTDLVMEQTFDAGLGDWNTVTDLGALGWVARTERATSRDVAWGSGGANQADHSVISAPLTVRTGDQLHFDQRYSFERWYDDNGEGGGDAEGGFAYDGGQVLISTDDGASWTNLVSEFSENGPSLRATTDTNGAGGPLISPVAGEWVFSGDSGGWQHAAADLSGWAGQTVRLRFRTTSDVFTQSDGWWIDDVQVGRRVRLAAQVWAAADGLTSRSVTVSTPVSSGAPDAPTSVKAKVLSKTTAQVQFVAPAYNGEAVVTGYTVTCTAPGGVTRTVTGAGSPLNIGGLSVGRRYVCTVRAANSVGLGAGAASPAFVQGLKPAAPRVKTVKALGKRKLKVTLKAGDNGGVAVSRYAVTCRAKGGKTRSASGARPVVTLTKLTAKKKYTCRATATNKVGTSAWGKPSKKVRVR